MSDEIQNKSTVEEPITEDAKAEPEKPEKPEVDLTPQLSTELASYLKLVLGKSVITVENFTQIVPPLVQALDGIITGKLLVVKNPNPPEAKK